AAEQGNADAQVGLGSMYELGKGVPQDDKQAVTWYHKAAEQGNAEAQFNLGVMYAKGQGVPQDYKQAAVWYR
ncbi:tetratricopeptide repeat protein, partial [Aeromonas caviae]|uniref:tetratricopeptide repeat protein n=1 Tax=Aeromonas caviae TaxID=648 RepID=UPI001FBB5E75